MVWHCAPGGPTPIACSRERERQREREREREGERERGREGERGTWRHRDRKKWSKGDRKKLEETGEGSEELTQEERAWAWVEGWGRPDGEAETFGLAPRDAQRPPAGPPSGVHKGGFSKGACFQCAHQKRNLMYYNCTRETHKSLNPPLLNSPL